MFPCHLPSAFSYSASSLQPFTAQLRGDVLCVLATHKLSHSSMTRTPTSPNAAISTSSASTRSDATHILLLTSSPIPRRFGNSTFRMHSCHPSACTRTIRSREMRLGHGETMPRLSHSPRASAQVAELACNIKERATGVPTRHTQKWTALLPTHCLPTRYVRKNTHTHIHKHHG